MKERYVKLSDIKIKDSLLNSLPRERKMNECRCNYLTFGKQDRFIVINHRNELIDGYIMYLILDEQGIEYAEVKISNRRKENWYRKKESQYAYFDYRIHRTTYIWGVHSGNLRRKPYIWRVPDSWTDWADDIKPGDEILVHTKKGIKPVMVVALKELDKCPVDFKVREVVSKIRNEATHCKSLATDPVSC